MAQPTSFLIPHPMATVALTARHNAVAPQEPKNTTDKPAGTTGAAPTGPGTATTQAPGSPQNTQSPGMCADPTTLLFMGGALALMYFMVLRPDQKRRKQQQDMLAKIKAGDQVVTLGGMHGTVAAVDDKTVTLRVDNVRMVFDRSAIARVGRDERPADGAKG